MTELGNAADLLVVAGGDGTILRAVGQLGEVIKPIFGINVGSLGFLTCANSSTYREAVECIAKDRINFSQRALLEARVKLGEKQTAKMIALNDAVLSRGELSRLVILYTRINGEPLTEFNADGLIVATPTGSTAYSLSAGRPILDPESGVFVITPICPHVLTNRSIIVANESTIEIEASDPDYPVFLTLEAASRYTSSADRSDHSQGEENVAAGLATRGLILQRRSAETEVEREQFINRE